MKAKNLIFIGIGLLAVGAGIYWVSRQSKTSGFIGGVRGKNLNLFSKDEDAVTQKKRYNLNLKKHVDKPKPNKPMF